MGYPSTPSSYFFDNTEFAMIHLNRVVRNFGQKMENMSTNSKPDDRVCYERRNVVFTIRTWADRIPMMESRGFSPEFAEADFKDRFVYSNPGEAINLDPTGVLKSHLNEEGKLDYTYGQRLFDQWDCIIPHLKDHQDTRQAFLAVWNPNIDPYWLGHRRVPCSLGYQFRVDGDTLEMTYIMRSTDLNGCLPNDIYTSTRTLEYVAEQIGKKPGPIHFFCLSLHLFEEARDE